MKIGKAITISSLVIPVLLFLVISVLLIFKGGLGLLETPTDLLNIFLGAFAHAFFAALFSTFPIIIIGYPIANFAQNKNKLTIKTILVGFTILGGLYMMFLVLIFTGQINLSVSKFIYGFASGSAIGFVTGIIFYFVLKPNKPIQPTAERGS